MIKLLLASVMGAAFAVCVFSDVTIEIGKDFTLTKGQTATLVGGDLKIKMLRAGRSQQRSGGDSIFCTFDLADRSEHREVTLDVGESVSVGDKSAKLTKVDLTTSPNAKDPWESNACSFVVTKIDK